MAGRYVILWAPTLLVHGGIEACQRYLVSQSACLSTLLASICASNTEELQMTSRGLKHYMFEFTGMTLNMLCACQASCCRPWRWLAPAPS